MSYSCVLVFALVLPLKWWLGNDGRDVKALPDGSKSAVMSAVLVNFIFKLCG